MHHDDILQNADKILGTLAHNLTTSANAIHWAHEITMRTYADQICALVQVKTGLQFSAKHCTVQSLKDFDIIGVAEQMQVKVPHLWELLGVLLAADSSANAFRESRAKQHSEKMMSRNIDQDIVMGEDNSEAEHWQDQDDPILEHEHDKDEAMK
ncbi:hypothetical protein L208DRAFT_1256391 [Tricholoma matsutake]|nr:hypothetical protein L208DRAFT_1256391 [Tricholoma matsutake 945]